MLCVFVAINWDAFESRDAKDVVKFNILLCVKS